MTKEERDRLFDEIEVPKSLDPGFVPPKKMVKRLHEYEICEVDRFEEIDRTTNEKVIKVVWTRPIKQSFWIEVEDSSVD